jgi:Uma2 family endonuclease
MPDHPSLRYYRTIDHDREIKLPLYAAAGISEVWLVDLRAEKLERHTEPRDGIFTHIQIAGRGESLPSTILAAVILSIDMIPGEDEKG